MKQVLVVFHLREGSTLEAEKLAAADPPFDPEAAGFTRLAVYVTRANVIFVLEGKEPEWTEDELVGNFLQPALHDRLDEWRKLADVETWPVQPAFFWESSTDA
jgi:hypothetical protein